MHLLRTSLARNAKDRAGPALAGLALGLGRRLAFGPPGPERAGVLCLARLAWLTSDQAPLQAS